VGGTEVVEASFFVAAVFACEFCLTRQPLAAQIFGFGLRTIHNTQHTTHSTQSVSRCDMRWRSGLSNTKKEWRAGHDIPPFRLLWEQRRRRLRW
jgi:hypothetical protein